MIFANENLSLQNLFAVAGFYRRTFPSRLYAGSFRHAMRAAPLQREAFTANVVTLVLLSQAVLLSHFSPALVPSACSCAPCRPHHILRRLPLTLRVPPPSRRETVMGGKATDHMFFPRCRTKKQGACDAPYQRAVPCGFWIGRRLYYAVIYQETHTRITRQNPL